MKEKPLSECKNIEIDSLLRLSVANFQSKGEHTKALELETQRRIFHWVIELATEQLHINKPKRWNE